MVQVLLIDDDSELRALLRAVLHADGHAVLEASDGMEALAHVADSVVPLIVILDWHMPRLEGFGVLHAAGDARLAARHRFVLVTAEDVAQNAAHCALLDHLQVSVLRKPFDIAALSQVVAEATSRLVASAVQCSAPAWG